MLAQAAVFLSIATLIILLLVAARNDVAAFRIPNSISLALLGLTPFFWWAVASHPYLDFAGILPSLVTAAIVFAIGFALFAGGLMGAGDVKLMAALALWIGPTFAKHIFTVIIIAGGVVALVIAVKAYARIRKSGEKATLRELGKHHVPYGVAIAFGGWVFSGQLILNALAQ